MTDASSKSLDRTLLSGATWMATTKWMGQLVTWASTILVARLLSPSDYGIITMASVFLASLAMLSEFGIGLAIVSMHDLSEDHLRQLNALAVLLGVTGLLLSAMLAVPLGYFFRTQDLPPVVAALGLTFLLGAFQVVPAGLLRRELAFRSLARIDLVRGLCVAGLTLAAAMAGLRYWALVVGSVAAAFLGAGMTVWLRPVGFRTPRIREIAHVIRFSRDLLVARFAWVAYQEGDFAVAGRMLGPVGAGTYGVAWTIARSPLEKISMAISDITPAMFSAVKSDQVALRRYFSNLTELLALVMFPAAVGLACISHDLVAVALGSKWSEAALPLALIALYSATQGVTTPFSALYSVVGQQQYLARRSVVSALVLVPGFIIGSHWGAAGIAAAWLALYPLLLVYSYSGVRISLSLPGSAYLRLLRFGLDGSVVMAVVLGIFEVFVASSWPPLVRLITAIALGAVTFAGTTWVIHSVRLRQVIAWAIRARKGDEAPAPA